MNTWNLKSIAVKPETWRKLGLICKKTETYDDVINKLLEISIIKMGVLDANPVSSRTDVIACSKVQQGSDYSDRNNK